MDITIGEFVREPLRNYDSKEFYDCFPTPVDEHYCRHFKVGELFAYCEPIHPTDDIKDTVMMDIFYSLSGCGAVVTCYFSIDQLRQFMACKLSFKQLLESVDDLFVVSCNGAAMHHRVKNKTELINTLDRARCGEKINLRVK